MHWYNEKRSQQRDLCSFAFTFAQIIEQTIFAQISTRTTPEQFAAASQTLGELCQQLERQMDWSHYPAASGMHACVRDVYTDAAFRLKNLAIMHQPAPLPANQQVVTVEGVVIEAEERVQTTTVETDLGREDEPPPSRNGR
jgi:hypothetical protein